MSEPNRPAGLMVVKLLSNSLLCVAVAAVCSKASAEVSGDRASSPNTRKSHAVQGDVTEFAQPVNGALVVKLGRSRLMRFPGGVHRTALSNVDSSAVIQINSSDVLVLGMREGTADLTVWQTEGDREPMVIVVRVEGRDGAIDQ